MDYPEKETGQQRIDRLELDEPEQRLWLALSQWKQEEEAGEQEGQAGNLPESQLQRHVDEDQQPAGLEAGSNQQQACINSEIQRQADVDAELHQGVTIPAGEGQKMNLGEEPWTPVEAQSEKEAAIESDEERQRKLEEATLKEKQRRELAERKLAILEELRECQARINSQQQRQEDLEESERSAMEAQKDREWEIEEEERRLAFNAVKERQIAVAAAGKREIAIRAHTQTPQHVNPSLAQQTNVSAEPHAMKRKASSPALQDPTAKRARQGNSDHSLRGWVVSGVLAASRLVLSEAVSQHTVFEQPLVPGQAILEQVDANCRQLSEFIAGQFPNEYAHMYDNHQPFQWGSIQALIHIINVEALTKGTVLSLPLYRGPFLAEGMANIYKFMHLIHEKATKAFGKGQQQNAGEARMLAPIPTRITRTTGIPDGNMFGQQQFQSPQHTQTSPQHQQRANPEAFPDAAAASQVPVEKPGDGVRKRYFRIDTRTWWEIPSDRPDGDDRKQHVKIGDEKRGDVANLRQLIQFLQTCREKRISPLPKNYTFCAWKNFQDNWWMLQHALRQPNGKMWPVIERMEFEE